MNAQGCDCKNAHCAIHIHNTKFKIELAYCWTLGTESFYIVYYDGTREVNAISDQWNYTF